MLGEDRWFRRRLRQLRFGVELSVFYGPDADVVIRARIARRERKTSYGLARRQLGPIAPLRNGDAGADAVFLEGNIRHAETLRDRFDRFRPDKIVERLTTEYLVHKPSPHHSNSPTDRLMKNGKAASDRSLL